MMSTLRTCTANFFEHIITGTPLPARVSKQIKTSEHVWVECATTALEQNNISALQFLQHCAHGGGFYKVLSAHDASDDFFFRCLAWCPRDNLQPLEIFHANFVGRRIIDRNESDVFFDFFSHFKKPIESMVAELVKYSVFSHHMEIAEFIIPYAKSSDCIVLLSESVLSGLSCVDALLRYMTDRDIGVACAKIAHVDRNNTRPQIVEILNAHTGSWEAFCAYDNSVARDWMASAYAHYQSGLLHQYLCGEAPLKAKSKM